jgi:hypothetical protein
LQKNGDRVKKFVPLSNSERVAKLAGPRTVPKNVVFEQHLFAFLTPLHYSLVCVRISSALG